MRQGTSTHIYGYMGLLSLVRYFCQNLCWKKNKQKKKTKKNPSFFFVHFFGGLIVYIYKEGAEDEHKNDDFIVPDDVDSDSGNEKNKSDADTPAGERKKRVLVDSDEEE